MPNHVTNVIEIKDNGGLSLDTIRAGFINDKSMIDFNIIAEIPARLKDFEPHCGIISAAEALVEAPMSGVLKIAGLELSNRSRDLGRYHSNDDDCFSDEEKALVDRAVSNYKECGFFYWYDWQNANWGTKWNAYSQPENGWPKDTTKFEFQTAWNHPFGLVKKLSEKLPDVIFSVHFADEDLGSNCGSYEIKDGDRSCEDIAPNWSDMSDEDKKKYQKFAFSICHPDTDPREYGYDENWDYNEEIEEAYWQEMHGNPTN